MASVVKYIVVLAMFIQIAQSISICQSVCEGTCKGCMMIAESLPGVLARVAAIVTCKTAEGVCLATCQLAGL